MGFINKAASSILKFGKKAKEVAGAVGPYARAAVNTVANNPGFSTQLLGLAGGATALGAEVAAGGITGGATALPAAATGAALMGMGKKTFGDISKAYKSELKAAKGKGKGGGKLKISADDVSKLKEAKANIGKAKKVFRDSQVNVNE